MLEVKDDLGSKSEVKWKLEHVEMKHPSPISSI
jgi:hypothetical protein